MHFRKFIRSATDYYLNKKSNHFFLWRFCTLLLAFGVLGMVNTVNAIGNNNPVKAEIRQKVLSGDWIADSKNDKTGKIEITFIRPSIGVPNAIGIRFSLSELKGLTGTKLNSQKTEVSFISGRDAGTFAFEGYFERGRGMGSWTFTSNREFILAMGAQGYKNLSDDDLLKAAIYNLTLKFIEDLKVCGYGGLVFQELLRVRANNVDSEYIEEVKEIGFGRQPLDTLIWMRNNNITRKYLSQLKAQGYGNITIEKLIELREQSQ